MRYDHKRYTNSFFNFNRFINDKNGNQNENPLAVWDHEMVEAEHDELSAKKGSNPKKSHKMESPTASPPLRTEWMIRVA